MNVLKLLLYPFAAIYNGVMRIRNHLYDSGQKPTFSFETAVISVGNLNVGGSGKTPMVEYLIQLLGNRFPTVTLSRGYRRETTGYRIAGSQDTAKSIGDEPFQMYRKFGDVVHVAVGEDRVFAIPNILHEFPDTRVLLLDDALQQRSIHPSLSILLTAADRFTAILFYPLDGCVNRGRAPVVLMWWWSPSATRICRTPSRRR
jgi:tetraacyldisaccharide 4'-kinase